jgi:replicative DNA helicase
MEFINIELERSVMRCIFWSRKLLVKYTNRGSVPLEVYTDKSIRMIIRLIVENFRKTGSRVTASILDTKIERLKTKGKQKDLEAYREKLRSIVDKFLEQKPTKKDVANFDVYTQELIDLWKGRMLQEHTMELYETIDKRDIEGAAELVNSFSLNSLGEETDEASMCSNFAEREGEVLKKVNNPEMYELLSTGIPDLDNQLGGGFDRELVIVGGSSNAGKSFVLAEFAANARRAGKNIIVFTIEMQKIPTQNRLDCNLAGLPFDFFRNPAKNYTEKLHNKWKRRMGNLKKKGGRLHVVAFKQNAKMSFIKNRCYELMNEWDEPIDGIYIDYLDDIEPEGQYQSQRDWTSFGEISWDMHLLAHHFRQINGTEGVPVITAQQFKKSSKEVSLSPDLKNQKTRKLDERDTGSSPLPYRHADVYIGIQTAKDGIASVLVPMKGRFVSKASDLPILCFHNFKYGKFHDESAKAKFMEGLSEEEKEDREAIMEIENPEDENGSK